MQAATQLSCRVVAPASQPCRHAASTRCQAVVVAPAFRAPQAVARRCSRAGGRSVSLAVRATAQQVAAFSETAPQRVLGADGQLAQFSGNSGVYAVYDSTGTLQYIGLSRKVSVSVGTHYDAFPELVHSVKVVELAGGSKEELQEAWKQWIQEAVAETGEIPAGNAPGETKWQQRRPRAAKPEIRLTPGKGLQDLTVPLVEIIDQVVRSNRAVAFIKGSRTAPQCGFSHKVLTILQELGAEFEVVNVLDEIYNPELREVIKTYSQWPTIPQVFVGGEFIGGADIVEQMHTAGELKVVLQEAGAVRR